MSNAATQSPEASAVRRLFTREPRHVPSRSRLVVTANPRNPEIVRIYHLIDNGPSTRPTIHRYWNISDIRRIDGLGGPASETTRFALHIIPNKVFTFRTHSPKARANFIWSLLQVSVSKMKRAPPVQNLRLLELQHLVDNCEGQNHAVDAQNSAKKKSSQSSLEKSVPASDHSSQLQRQTPEPSRKESTETTPSKLTTSEAATKSHSRHQSSKETDLLLQNSSQDNSEQTAPSQLHVQRAISGPKHQESKKEGMEVMLEEAGSDPALRSEQGHSRAKSGTKTTFTSPASRSTLRVTSEFPGDTNVVSPQFDQVPKAQFLENRRIPNVANTKTFMQKLQIQKQREQAKLSDQEQAEISFALELFQKEADPEIHEFGKWLEDHIQMLDVDNIGDIVTAESRDPCRDPTEAEYTGSWSDTDKVDFHDVLIKSVTTTESWLRKCESLLKPYADLSETINEDLTLLDLRRENSRALRKELERLLETICFASKEKEIVKELDGVLSVNGNEMDYSELHKVFHLLSSKAKDIADAPELSKMTAVADVKKYVAENQNRASASLLPSLKSYLEKLYAKRQQIGIKSQISVAQIATKHSETMEEGLQNFEKGTKCLVACSNDSLATLIDHYVALSSLWITDVLRFLMRAESHASGTKVELDDRVQSFAENFLYISILEGKLALALFANVLSSPQVANKIEISSILRRQFPAPKLLNEFLDCEKTGDKEFRACVHQHFWHSIESFAEKLTGISDFSLHEMKSAVERRLHASEARLNKNVFSTHNINPESKHQIDTATKEIVVSFQEKCRMLSSSSQLLVETHANDVVNLLSESLELKRPSQRGIFFSRVRAAVDLCVELSAPLCANFHDSKSGLKDKTQAICEMLVGAALRRTEVASASAGERADEVKLQCYSYITAKLNGGQGEKNQLNDLARLPSRVREHLIVRWAEKVVFSKTFCDFDVDSLGRTPEAYSRFRAAAARLSASSVFSNIKNSISSALEEAGKTCAIVPFYSDVILLLKERMEIVLRRARNDRAISDLRPNLRSFTTELLGKLRLELDRKRETYKGSLQQKASKKLTGCTV